MCLAGATECENFSFFLVLKLQLYLQLICSLIPQLIRAEAETSLVNENIFLHVTLVFDDN